MDDVQYLTSDGSMTNCNLYVYCNNNPITYSDPNGTFVVTTTAIVLGMLAGGAIGAGLGLGSAFYADYTDDQCINNSIGTLEYVARTIGGGIAGTGIGLATTLGGIAGTAALLETTATLGGVTVNFGTAMFIGTGVATITGMGGYTARALINPNESYNFGTMLAEGAFSALNASLSVCGGYLSGICGFRAGVATKLLKQGGDLAKHILMSNIFTGGLKISNTLIKNRLLY